MDKKGCIGVLVWILLIFICGIILIAFGSCRSIKYVPVEKVSHDSIYITQHQKDSIYLHDSIHIREKSDTILIEKWRTRYVEKIVIDTLIQIERDTIPQPYPVEVEMPARLSWWQQTRIHLGELLIAMILAIVGWWIYKRKGTT